MAWKSFIPQGSPFIRLLSVVLVGVLSLPAFSQETATSAPQSTSVTKRRAAKNPEDLTARIGFDLSQESYPTPSVIDNGSNQKYEVDLSLTKKGMFFTRSQVILGSYSMPNSFYFSLPEAYVGWGDRFNSYTLGKKIENLSHLDNIFNMGLVQPFSTQDNIYHVKGGLVALAAHYYDGSVGFNIGLNPMFIPNQGPQVRIDDGKVINATRWAQTPPSQFKFGDDYRDIVYALRDYKITDIIGNAGYTANVYFGKNQDAPALSLSYGQKPVNELALSRDTYSDIANFKGNVVLNPVVLNHEFYAADLTWTYDNFRATFSYLGDHPINKTAPGLETIQTLSPLSITGAYFGLDLSAAMNKPVNIYLALANVAGGEIVDLNSAGQSGTFNFATSRTLFRRPIRVGVKGEMFYIYNRAFEADVNFTRDADYKGSMLAAQFKYSPFRNLSVHVGADIIGTDEETGDTGVMNTNFFDQNKANDRFTAGVGYVF